MAKDRECFQIMRSIYLLLVAVLIGGGLTAQPTEFQSKDYTTADSIATVLKGESLSNLPLLAYKLTSSLPSQVEKYRAIYRWVFENIDYDFGGFVKNRKMRAKFQEDEVALDAWNTGFRTTVFDKLLHKQKTVCTGYAYLVRELANLADLECEIIDGYGRTVTANVNEGPTLNHSWNVVKLDGKWYVSDPTWANVEIENSDGRFKKTYNDGYFLPDPVLFLKSHYPLDTAWMLTSDKPSIQDFLEAPLLYRGAFNHQILPISPSKMKHTILKGTPWTIELKVQDESKLDLFMFQVFRGKAAEVITPTLSHTAKDTYELQHTFNSSGKYDIHLMYGNDYLITYTVTVKKSK